jgi:hypothetical protein
MNHQIIFLSNQVSPEQRHTTCLGVHPGTALTRMRKYELLRAHSLASRVKGSTILSKKVYTYGMRPTHMTGEPFILAEVVSSDICYPSRAVTAVGKKTSAILALSSVAHL